MKRPLLLASVLALTPLMAGTAKADPLQMFNIVTPSAGVVNFSGTGTANFNQSLGATNNVSLSSSTNVGVNASASSTSDYGSSGFAKLDLDRFSRLQQTTGTAAQAFNTNTAAEASARSAHTSAMEKANSSTYGVEYTSSYDTTYAQEGGWEVNSAYDSTLDLDDTATAKYKRMTSDGVEYMSETSFSAESQRSWQAGWENTYNQAYDNAYEVAVNTATSSEDEMAGVGVIVANFKTTETGSAASASSALTASFERSAAAEADYEWGASYTSGDSRYESEADYDRKWEAAYQSAYSAAYASADAQGERESTSEVTVQGIGSISDIASSNTSTFEASSDLLVGADRLDSIGNGSASASANLGTSSFASQANNTTASAFMQAFTGGGMGQTIITGIEDVTGDGANDPIKYNVTTERVTTVTDVTEYTVDDQTNAVTLESPL